MKKRRISRWLRGYYVLTVEGRNAACVLRLLMKNGIAFESISTHEFLFLPKYKRQLLKIMPPNQIYKLSKLQGLPARGKDLFCHVGVTLAITVLAAFFICISQRVSDVRLDENCEVQKTVIEKELSSAGLYAGARWRDVDFSKIENTVLENSNTIGWIGIYKRGVVAYVTARQKNAVPEDDFSLSYANIVADCDGVVEEIHVKSGVAAVRVGDTVKKGDLLISGIVKQANATIFTEAAGEVSIVTFREMSVFVPFQNSVKTLSSLGVNFVSLRIFERELNIFKNSRNLAPECVIINKIKRFVLFEKYPLPITLTIGTAYETGETIVTQTVRQTEKIAESRFQTEMRKNFKDADLISSKISTEITGEGVTVRGSFFILQTTQKSVPILIE